MINGETNGETFKKCAELEKIAYQEYVVSFCNRMGYGTSWNNYEDNPDLQYQGVDFWLLKPDGSKQSVSLKSRWNKPSPHFPHVADIAVEVLSCRKDRNGYNDGWGLKERTDWLLVTYPHYQTHVLIDTADGKFYEYVKRVSEEVKEEAYELFYCSDPRRLSWKTLNKRTLIRPAGSTGGDNGVSVIIKLSELKDAGIKYKIYSF